MYGKGENSTNERIFSPANLKVARLYNICETSCILGNNEHILSATRKWLKRFFVHCCRVRCSGALIKSQ